MEIESVSLYPEAFEFEGRSQPISFTRTMNVTEGVKCDVYNFPEDPNKDLGIIRIRAGAKTPQQRVLQGIRTIEGHINGSGRLVVIREGGKSEVYPVDPNAQDKLIVHIKIGDVMQWIAEPDSCLTVYEICIPPYQDGRYEDLG